jgi:hypothetical protein
LEPAGDRRRIGSVQRRSLPIARRRRDRRCPRWPRRSAASGQALTVVYRVLFFLFAEARGLVPVWHEVYREAYTIDALCRRIDARPDATGLWAALQAISRLAHGGCRAGDLEVTAFNGRLFAPWHSPLTEKRRVPDDVVRRMITALATSDIRGARHRIAYHDLGVEQLGSVYVRVLESPERKSTGSFTRRAITEFLVRRTLPAVDGKSPATSSTFVVDRRWAAGRSGRGVSLPRRSVRRARAQGR